MKSKKSLRIFLIIMVVLLAFGLAACNDDDENKVTPVDYGEGGVYTYYSENISAEYILTLNSNSFTLDFAGKIEKGVYSYDGTTLKFKFDGSQDFSAAALNDDRLTLTYGGDTYTFVRRKLLNVTFDVDGNKTVRYVMNGRPVAKPAIPEKKGYTFIAWYDNSDFSGKPYKFDSQPIAADLNLFARFIKNEAGERVYTAEFIVEGKTTATLDTNNGVLYNLPVPDGDGVFLGWWISDFQSEEKLTAKYDGQKLTANTKLFAVWESEAPAVSVTANGVSWTAPGVGNSYDLKITGPDGTVDTKKSGETAYAFNFSEKAAGEYIVEVTLNDKTVKAYYNNKALSRVSQFTVVEPSILLFNKIENAQKYIITVSSGSATEPQIFDNGDYAAFDFGDLAMQPGGIRFTVTAKADGFADSVSDEYVCDRSLSPVTGLVYGESEARVYWDAVDKAVAYKVTLKNGGVEYTYSLNDINSISVKEFTGEITVEVVPWTTGYNSPEKASVTFTKSTIGAPKNIRVEGTCLKWDAVEGAKAYEVKIDSDVLPSLTATQLDLTSNYFKNGKKDYQISVRTLTETESANSFFSDAIIVKYLSGPSGLNYSDGVVSWQPVIGAAGYGIKVNGGNVLTISTNQSSQSVKLTKSGDNIISVCYYNSEGSASEWAEISVWAATIYFDVNGGNIIDSPKRYYAVGDKVDLPVPSRDGYSFNGWYNIPTGTDGVGEKFTGEVFDFHSDIILFASWKAVPIEVELVVDGNYGVPLTSGQDKLGVVYKEAYSLPVVEIYDGRFNFVGWYSEPEEAGVQYTDANGNGFNVWMDLNKKILYAGFREVFSFSSVTQDKEYSVSKGPEIALVTSVKIPAEYNRKPVTIINSFQSSYNLASIEIPDSVLTIEETAFKYCSKLQDVNVYHVEGNLEIVYESIDGVLVEKKDGGAKEMLFWPSGRIGDIVIPNGVTHLPMNVLKSSYNITSITVPASVVSIGDSAFYSSSKLEKVTFLPSKDGNEMPLSLGATLFQNCYALTEVSFPGRLQAVDGLDDVFYGCTYLENINIVGIGTYYTSKEGVLCSADGTTIIYAPRGRSGDYVIPDGVKTVGQSAFEGRYKLTKITIPAYVTTIEDNAFYGTSYVREIIFEGDATSPNLSIGESAFYGSYYVTEITLPVNLKHLGAYAFGGISTLKKVVVESGVFNEFDSLDFKAKAFMSTSGSNYVQELILGEFVPNLEINSIFGGSSLTAVKVDEDNQFYSSDNNVLFSKDGSELLYYPYALAGNEYTVPESVTKIGAGVFKNNKILNKINIGKNVVSIGEEAFAGSVLSEVTFVTGGTESLIIGKSAFKSMSRLTDIELPERLTTIGENAFESAVFTSIEIPEGVTEIKNSAFISSNLETVYISSTVNKMGGYDANGNLTSLLVFDKNNNLTEITVNENNAVFASADGVLFGKTAGVIKEVLFSPLNKTSSVNLPSTITKIRDKAFYNNKLLTAVTFNDGLTGSLEIGQEAFSGCTALAFVQLPAGTKTIGEKAFYGCGELTTVNIPSTVTAIGKSAFYNAAKLFEVTFEAGETPLSIDGGSSTTGAFSKTSLIELVIPERAVLSDYTFYGIETLTSVQLPYTFTSVPNYLFDGCKSLSSVSFAKEGEKSRLSTIGDYAFRYTALKEIDLPESLTSIGKNAFYGVTGLTEIYIPKNVAVIGSSAFSYMPALKIVQFADGISVNKIDTYVFNNNYELKTISLPESVTTIASSAFTNDYKLESVVLPGGLISIGSSAFKNTYALETIILPETLVSIDSSAFNGSGLKSVTIPSKVASIGASAFAYSDIETITFEQKTEIKVKDKTELVGELSSIGNWAFESTRLRSFVFPVTKASLTLGSSLFEGCNLLKTVTLSKSVTNITDVFTDNIYIEEFIVAADSEHFRVSEDFPIIYNKEGNAIRLVYKSIMFDESDPDAGVYTIASNIEEIGAKAFDRQTYITKLIIPASVKSIGDYAFKDLVNLETVEFLANSKLKTLGASAFYNCVSLKSINIPEGVTDIGNYTFQNCLSLENIVLPSTLKTIGYSAFENCASLKSVTLPEGLETIDYYAFRYSGLESVKIPSTVTVINSDAFRYTNIKSVNIESNFDVTFGSYTFADNVKLATIKFEGLGVKKLGTYMFTNCTALTSLTLPESLEVISEYAFQNTALSSVTIPASVKRIAKDSTSSSEQTSYAFANCVNLETIIFAENGNLERIGQYAFKNTPVLGDVVIPSTVKYLDGYAFQDSGITSVKLSDAAFGSSVFDNATRLSNVEFDANTTKLGTYYMFSDAIALKSIDLPASITDMGSSTFANSGLEKFVLPAGVTIIKSSTFNGCAALSEVVLHDSLKEIQFSAFRATPMLKEITLPASLTTLGNTVFQQSGLTSIVLPGKVRQLGNYAFDDCKDLESADIQGVSTIGSEVFRNCEKLTSITIPETVTSISDYAFENCSFTEIFIPESVVTIDEGAFAGCKTLTEFKVAANSLSFEARDGVLYNKNNNTLLIYPAGKDGRIIIEEGTSIAPYAFSGVDKPIEIVLPDTDIASYTFGDFAGLVSIVVPEGVTSIGNNAFYGAINLKTITLPSTLISIGSSAFYGASSLKTIEWPNGSNLQTIGTSAFRDAVSLETFVMPETLTSIGNYAFQGDSSLSSVQWPAGGNLISVGSYSFKFTALTSVELPASVTEVLSSTFSEMPELETVTLHDGITSLGTYAFSNNPKLSSVKLPSRLETLSGSVFRYDTMLTSITLPETLTEIADYAFSESGIENIVIPATIETIGAGAFKLSGLKSVEIKEGAASSVLSKSSIFEDCQNLSSVKLSSTIIDVGTYLFKGSKSLKHIDLPTGMEINVTSTFFESGIESIVVPAGFTVIGTNAFENCTSLKEVIISEGITTINQRAFAGCTALVKIVLPSTLTRIGSDQTAAGSAFENCTSLKEIVIPAGCSDVYAYSFVGWTSEQTVKIEAAPHEVTGFWNSRWHALSDAQIVWNYVPGAEE